MKVLTNIDYTEKTLRILCENCSNTLEINEFDVKTHVSGAWYYSYFYITCPVCEHQVIVSRNDYSYLKSI